MINSCVYTGTVFHQRHGAVRHQLSYRVFYLLLDLDELERVNDISRWMGCNRPAWFSYYDSDHGENTSASFRGYLNTTLADRGLDDPAWRFCVLCLPRVLGYAFNPISAVYCYRSNGHLGAMVYEVNNTFGERVAYVIPVTDDARDLHQVCDKSLFVSPFFALDGHYEFFLNQPAEHLNLTIDYHREGQHRLRAAFSGEKHPLDQRTLRRLALAFPLLSLKVIAAIHLEALRLWLKGVPLIKHQPRAKHAAPTGKSL